MRRERLQKIGFCSYGTICGCRQGQGGTSKAGSDAPDHTWDFSFQRASSALLLRPFDALDLGLIIRESPPHKVYWLQLLIAAPRYLHSNIWMSVWFNSWLLRHSQVDTKDWPSQITNRFLPNDTPTRCAHYANSLLYPLLFSRFFWTN